MYTIERVSARHLLADVPIQMPVDYVLAIPPYESLGMKTWRSFNLPEAINHLLGYNNDFEKATQIIHPYFWIPGWDQFNLSRLNPNIDYSPWSIIYQFPGTSISQDPITKKPRTFEIVHFKGNIGQLDNGQSTLFLDKNEQLAEKGLTAGLMSSETRLFIIETKSGPGFSYAVELGRRLVKAGGPITLIVTSDFDKGLDKFFEDWLADLVHNRLFLELETPVWSNQSGIFFWLIISEGSEELFNFDSYRLRLENQLADFKVAVEEAGSNAEDLSAWMGGYLHVAQQERLETQPPDRKTLQNVRQEINAIEIKLERAAQPWDHENEGAIPTSEAATTLEELVGEVSETNTLIDKTRESIKKEAKKAPRVLNANFKDPSQDKILEPDAALQAGQEYNLLVDVGPRWNDIISIVSGKDEFPENALPPGENGYVIQVMVVSEDFSPSIISGEMWVPSASGRSFPVVDDEVAENSGPLSLILRAPEFEKGSRKRLISAEARLCLYYENNLLQSANIIAGVTREGDGVLKRANSIEIDFALSGGFHGVEEQFATRAVEIGTAGILPVKLNLAMNQDRRGNHRFIVKGRLDGKISESQAATCPMNAWISYDPKSSEKDLKNARKKLSDCYGERDVKGRILYKDKNKKHLKYGLKKNLGKDLVPFKRDLLELAKLGSDLWRTAFGQPFTENEACTTYRWQNNLRSILTNSCLLQVSHLGMTHYVYPWSLLYDYNLYKRQEHKYKFCRIITEEWSRSGLRKPPPEERTVCKYHNENWHSKNVICPYGFWGLKHITEEPFSIHLARGEKRLGNVGNTVRIIGRLRLSVALTDDKELSQTQIKDHVKWLTNEGVHFIPAQPSKDYDSVIKMLHAPEAVYFLCHGEYDEALDDDYLGIGPRDKNGEHRVYSDNLASWAAEIKGGPDFDAWERQGPFVFINGCHTVDLKPGKIINFANTFARLGAQAILGTEISVDLPVAIEFAESVFKKIGPTGNYMPLGKAMRLARWELVNKGNLLGLAYTLYGMADLRLVNAES